MAQSPCKLPLITSLDNSPCTWVPLTYLESLLFVWCDPRPPWSQVACKLTSPSPFHFPAPNGSPNSIVRPFKTTSRHRLHIVRNSKVPFGSATYCNGASYNEFVTFGINHRRLSFWIVALWFPTLWVTSRNRSCQRERKINQSKKAGRRQLLEARPRGIQHL